MEDIVRDMSGYVYHGPPPAQENDRERFDYIPFYGAVCRSPGFEFRPPTNINCMGAAAMAALPAINMPYFETFFMN